MNERAGCSQDRAECTLSITKATGGGNIDVQQMRANMRKHAFSSSCRALADGVRLFSMAINPRSWYFCHSHEAPGVNRWNNGAALVASWSFGILCRSIYMRNSKIAQRAARETSLKFLSVRGLSKASALKRRAAAP